MIRFPSSPIVLGLVVTMSLVGSPADATPGAEGWTARYGGPANDADAARAIVVSPDGATVFVAGESAGGLATGYDYATVAYDTTTGGSLWAARFDGASGLDASAAIGITPDGSKVFVTGRSWNGTSNDYATIAYDATTGGQLWASTYQGPDDYDDNATALAVSPDGGTVAVTGNSKGSSSGSDFATIAYDASTGGELWATRTDGDTHGPDLGRAIGFSPDGAHVFVTGESWGRGTRDDYLTVGLAAGDGTQEWRARYRGLGGERSDIPTSLVVGPGGVRVFVTGWSFGQMSNEFATVAYGASDGARLWGSRFDGPGTGGDFARRIIASPDGKRVYVTGQSWGGSKEKGDYMTISYGVTNGGLRWRARYRGPGDGTDAATDIAQTPDGSGLFVTGETAAFTDDYTTVGYDPVDGTKLWVTRYDGPGTGTAETDRPWAIAASVTRVFVTGLSGDPIGGNDFLTVAYDRT